MKTKLQDILDAIDMVNDLSQCFLDLETGAVEWVDEMIMSKEARKEVYDKLDVHGFLRLPSSYEINDYQIMTTFADSLQKNERERLASALRGRGAFRRFKDTVRRLGRAEEWYAFRDAAHRQLAIDWCEENGVEYEV